MCERFHIVMPSCRSRHLARIARRWLVEMEPHPFELRWYLFIQGPEPDPFGIRKTNEALGCIKEGWIMTASDDTVHDRALLRRLAEVAADNPRAQAVVFSERRPDGRILVAAPENMKRCWVDGQQVLWRAEFIQGYRLDFEQYREQVDGAMVEKFHGEHPGAFVFVDEVMVNFNSLEGAA